MFERRLRVILVLACFGALALTVRLFQIQVLQGAEFHALSEAALESPPQTLLPVRGRVLDRQGRILAADQPSYDVTVHYGLLSMSPDYLKQMARRARLDPAIRALPAAEAAEKARESVRERIAAMWVQLSRASGVPTAELRARRDELCRRVESLRGYIASARSVGGAIVDPAEVHLAEDEMRHPLIRDVSPAVRARIETDLADLPAVRVDASVRRAGYKLSSLSHVLGRMGEVSSAQMEDDPFRDDDLRRYLPGEKLGVSGVERLAESRLRGVRGARQTNRDGHEIFHVPPQDGHDVQLTIDADLQERVLQLLNEAIAAHPPATGAACVIIDVRSREVLALVSAPSYDPDDFNEHYRALRDDVRRRPLLFRAVSEEYPPGSILKPAALLAGLSSGIISPRDSVECRGRLLPDVDAWYCWTQWRHLAPHGPQMAVDALQHSCNVYFYTLGQRVGAARLTAFYRAILQGRIGGREQPAGVGLVAERDGFLPTEPELIALRKKGYQLSDSRNYALGQGEIQITPLQAANLFATIAAGRYREPTLIRNDDRPRPELALPGVSQRDLSVVWEGLYRCVNEPGGTAHEGARMDEIIVCGKTGSAQTVSRVTRWRFTFEMPDGREEQVEAPTLEAAREALGIPPTVRVKHREILERWPPPPEDSADDTPTHAWFAGFAPREDPRVAVALIIEFGASGGRVAAPIGRRVFEALLDSPAGYLTRDGGHDDSPNGRRRERSEPRDVE